MNEQRDGGPAFPRPESKGVDDWWHDHQTGMSLRDWFAGQALAGIDHESVEAEKAARWAYDAADAMLAAREAKL